MKALLKFILTQTPYRISRSGSANRFSAIEDALTSLRKRGLRPSHVIDAGANVGSFASFSLNLFPEALVHAIEPQPGCRRSLETLRSKWGVRLAIHQVALSSSQKDGSVLRLAADATSTFTGAHVISSGASGPTISVDCVSLDRLLKDDLPSCKGALLKLDLQGYELEALRGSAATLDRCDVVLTEVSFYAQAYEPSISALVNFFAGAGFELYDIASIYARPRDDRPRQGDFVFVRADSTLMADNAWS